MAESDHTEPETLSVSGRTSSEGSSSYSRKSSAGSSSRRVSEADSDPFPDQEEERKKIRAEYDDLSRYVDPVVIDNLAQGFMKKLQPDLNKSRVLLEELTENQRILIETIQQENGKFKDCQAYKEVVETMEKAKLYHTKLLNIKRDMIMLHDKSMKLKKRALRIKQQKEQELLEQEQSNEAALERERMLVAKPAKKPNSSNKTKSDP